MKKIGCAALLVLISLSLTACGKPPAAELATQTLQELYPGDIANVDTIEITHGGGERKLFTDKRQIGEWLSHVQQMNFEPDPNQEGSVGFLYRVTLREGKENKLTFTTSSLGGHYYIHNEELKMKIQELFEDGDVPIKSQNKHTP